LFAQFVSVYGGWQHIEASDVSRVALKRNNEASDVPRVALKRNIEASDVSRVALKRNTLPWGIYVQRISWTVSEGALYSGLTVHCTHIYGGDTGNPDVSKNLVSETSCKSKFLCVIFVYIAM
jgi:hypothetical protein